MPLAITHRSETDVPTPGAMGRVNQDLEAVKSEMQKLGSGMVLEIETEGEKGVRAAKMLVTRAANQLGSPWQHWHAGTSVFAKPAGGIRKRMGRTRKREGQPQGPAGKCMGEAESAARPGENCPAATGQRDSTITLRPEVKGSTIDDATMNDAGAYKSTGQPGKKDARPNPQPSRAN